MDVSAMPQMSEGEMTIQRKGISGSTIKIIAIVSMLIDHIGAVIVERMIAKQGLYNLDSTNLQEITNFLMENKEVLILNILDTVLRSIGRLGFPIFCFLLVEGFIHTRNVGKYAFRLFVFALISEIPFDLAFNGQPFYWGYQNVFFTLLIGLFVMIAYRAIEGLHINQFFKLLLYAAALAAGIVTSMTLQTDYGNPAGIGIICIMALYIFRKNKVHQIIAGCVTFLWEITAPLAFIPIGFYNGKRGLKMKYFFYAFYPVHLFILYLIAKGMGIV